MLSWGIMSFSAPWRDAACLLSTLSSKRINLFKSLCAFCLFFFFPYVLKSGLITGTDALSLSKANILISDPQYLGPFPTHLTVRLTEAFILQNTT